MKNPVEVTLIIVMMFMVQEIVSDSSIACFQHRDKYCPVHRLRCGDGKVIWITEAVFGYRSGCGLPMNKYCSSECCTYRETDCFLSFSNDELGKINSDCSGKEHCIYTNFIYQVLNTSLECYDKGIYVNAYTIINYKCITRSEYQKSSMILTSIRPLTIFPKSASTVESSTRLKKPITTLTAVVPSLSEPTATPSSMNVAATTVKKPTDQQSKGQPSGTIIGGTVAGVIMLVILVVIIVYFIKRRKKNLKQVSKRHKSNNVTRKFRISAPIALQNTTNPTISDDQKNGEISNRKSEYENVDLETAIDSTASLNHDYSQLETSRLSTCNLKTTAEPQSRGSDVYNHLGEDNSQQYNLDNSDYNHTSDFREDSDNYHHINADDFKIRDANDMDDDYSHIEDTSR